MIEIKVSIPKSDIAVLGKLKGLSNANTMTCTGIEYKPGTLVFLGFIGIRNDATGKWDGVMRFEEGISKDTHAFDLAKYKRVGAKRVPKEPTPAKGAKT